MTSVECGDRARRPIRTRRDECAAVGSTTFGAYGAIPASNSTDGWWIADVGSDTRRQQGKVRAIERNSHGWRGDPTDDKRQSRAETRVRGTDPRSRSGASHAL